MQRARLWIAIPALALLAGAALGCGRPATETKAEAPRSATPVLIIGIDGATWDLLTPLVEQGRVPHLAQLMRRGAWGPLETIEPTESPAIWTTVATGRLPEAHGILGFEGVPGQTMTTLPTSEMRRVRAFWNILSDAGRTVGTVGWWATWPAEAVNGYIVSDRATYTRMEAAIRDEGEKTHEVFPEALAPEVRRLVRAPGALEPAEVLRFMPLADDEVEGLIHGTEYRHGSLLPEFRYVVQSDRSTADIAVHLLETHPTDVTAVAFYGVDTVSHLAWHFMQPEKFPGVSITAQARAKFAHLIENYYAFLDEQVGRLLEAAAPGVTTIVFSDHGFGPTGHLPWSGGHGKLTLGAPLAPDGILILSGPPVRQGATLPRSHVLDLLPTLLYLEDLPAAEDMPGQVLASALRSDLVAGRVPRRVPTFETSPLHPGAGQPVGDPARDRDLLERMRALGYVK
jgi:hypothetical protein